MAQYFLLVNFDREQFVHANDLGGGLKLHQMAGQGGATASALMYLIGPEIPGQPVAGSWAEDNIQLVGDEATPGLWAEVLEEWTNISPQVRALLRDQLEVQYWTIDRTAPEPRELEPGDTGEPLMFVTGEVCEVKSPDELGFPLRPYDS